MQNKWSSVSADIIGSNQFAGGGGGDAPFAYPRSPPMLQWTLVIKNTDLYNKIQI